MEKPEIIIEYRSEEEKKKIQKRLNIIEGQVRGVKQMISDSRTTSDIAIQLGAINKSINSLGKYILKNHLDNYITTDIKNDKPNTTDTIMELFERLN